MSHYDSHICCLESTTGRRQSKTPILSRNVDKKSLEIEFWIAICRHNGDKWQLKTLFLSIFDPRLSIVDIVFDSRLPTRCGIFQLKILLGYQHNFLNKNNHKEHDKPEHLLFVSSAFPVKRHICDFKNL